ncbi:hypothetical protein TNCV_4145061 [Trichonephila clavipes]|nr:hypothetical protein TNCV_4145061 [Trichonephila clavipes]
MIWIHLEPRETNTLKTRTKFQSLDKSAGAGIRTREKVQSNALPTRLSGLLKIMRGIAPRKKTAPRCHFVQGSLF